MLAHLPVGETTGGQRWQALVDAGLLPWVCNTLYPYLNDTHIDSALRAIAKAVQS